MTMENPWKGFGLSDVGRVRSTNQDAWLIDDRLGLWVVADGMGGHAGGEVASQLTVDSIHEYLSIHAASTSNNTFANWREILQKAVEYANSTVRKHGKAKPALKGMGTTVVFVFKPNSDEHQAYVVHVGDSRAYLLRDRRLSAMTKDHTLLEERIQVGLLPKTTSSNHPLGHVLTRAVGIESIVEADVTNIQLQVKDEILLCSDGLIKMMKDEQILEVLENPDWSTTQETCKFLIDEANRLGGKDNATVILIRQHKE